MQNIHTPDHLQIHGHRGCRGLFPENTLMGFEHAISLGVDAIEMDVVMTGDGKILVSHEPWFSHKYCLDPSGNIITEENEKTFNLYKMSYEEIMQFDCGSVNHPSFPAQKNSTAHKPLLHDAIDFIIEKSVHHNKPVYFNIEIKSEPALYNIYQPDAAALTDAVMKIIYSKKIMKQCLLQSFDAAVLKHLHSYFPDMKCSFLVEDDPNPERDINNLNFKPFGYNPHYKLVNEALIEYCRSNKLQVLVWTVNDIDEMQKMQKTGVDGIITDYPDRAISLFRS